PAERPRAPVPPDHPEARGPVELACDLDAALRAGDVRHGGRLGPQRGAQQGLDATGVLERDRDLAVHPRLGEPAVRVHGRGDAEQVVGEGHGVDAEIEQGAARQLGVEEAVLGADVEPLPVVRAERDQLTDLPSLDDPAQDGDVRQEPRPHRLHDEHALRARGAGDLLRLRSGPREGLLDEHVLAGLDRGQRVLGVLRVRARDVHGIALRVRDESLVTLVRRGDAVLRGEALGADVVARAHRDDLGARVPEHRLGEGVGDTSGPDDPPLDGRCAGWILYEAHAPTLLDSPASPAVARPALRREARYFLGEDFLAAAFLAGDFFAGAFFAAAFLVVRFLVGPAARLSASSWTASSNVMPSTVMPLGTVRFVSPSVMYAPKRPSLMTIGLPDVGSSPSSRSGGVAVCPRPRLGCA